MIHECQLFDDGVAGLGHSTRCRIGVGFAKGDKGYLVLTTFEAGAVSLFNGTSHRLKKYTLTFFERQGRLFNLTFKIINDSMTRVIRMRRVSEVKNVSRRRMKAGVCESNV